MWGYSLRADLNETIMVRYKKVLVSFFIGWKGGGNIMSRLHFFITCAIVIVLTILVGAGFRANENKRIADYRNQLQQYVAEIDEFSAEEKRAAYAAINHIKNPDIIDDYRQISVYRISKRFSEGADIDLQTDDGRIIKPNDWQVDIGSSHRKFSAIIDGETFEFIMQIEIA